MFILVISLYVLFLVVGLKKGLIFTVDSCIVNENYSINSSDHELSSKKSIVNPVRIKGGRFDYYNDGLHIHRITSKDISIG